MSAVSEALAAGCTERDLLAGVAQARQASECRRTPGPCTCGMHLTPVGDAGWRASDFEAVEAAVREGLGDAATEALGEWDLSIRLQGEGLSACETGTDIMGALEDLVLPAVLTALSRLHLGAVAGEVRLRVALEAVEDRAVAVLTRFDGDQVGWRSYECGLCGGSWDEGADREHTESCPLSALAHPPSEAAQRPEETE